MTDHNARQAGLTVAERTTIQAAKRLADSMGNTWLSSDLETILAAHSADARNGEGVSLTDEQRDAIRHAVVILDHRENFGPNSPSRIASRVLTALLAAPAAPAPKDAEILQIIDERDAYHEIADDLAAQIAAITDVEIGEHSSVNDPWRNAMLAADDFIAKQLRTLLTAPAPAAPAPAPAARPISDALFCDLKTDVEKANFFLSGRGYATGVISRAIQNDVAMAYQRCANYEAVVRQQSATSTDRDLKDWWHAPDGSLHYGDGEQDIPQAAIQHIPHAHKAPFDTVIASVDAPAPAAQADDDLAAFAELIDDYQCAQKDGSVDDRAQARIALLNAYRDARQQSVTSEGGDHD
ncbi:hypothetical protein K6V90_09570 [Cupriavidus pauculus]|uniref:hypothetical protein n=1 Tax=Cupriavidus pauculus TaxID=82633 RepID=UPI001C93408B|nr:hypothetical protein [Cupriavidus pauculus]MBY4730780.1 hypothetical protein [Cupriavidus pauculus]